jgi:orotate phosphoribosyltransferase
MLPEGQSLIGSIIVDFMTKFGIGTVGGLEIGAVPVVAAVSHASFLCGSPVDAFFVRKRAKEHGAKELVDGNLREGAGVLMVDDVTTSGGSIIKAIDSVLSEKNIDVRWALSIVDREEGAAEALAARNILLASIFTRSDFGL